MRMRPRFSARATSSSPSVTDRHSGFSTRTSRSASRARLTSGPCVSAGVAMETAPTSPEASTSSKEAYIVASGYLPANSERRSGSSSHTPLRAPRPSKLRTRFLPQYPAPTTVTPGALSLRVSPGVIPAPRLSSEVI